MTEIIPGLYLGTAREARGFAGRTLCVLNSWAWDGAPDAVWLPVVRSDYDNLERPVEALVQNLDVAASLIADWLEVGESVLVYCREGRERGPLTVAWFLHAKHGWPIGEAYWMLKDKRPEVEDRTAWLPPGARS